MIDVYGSGSPNVLKVTIMLEELERDYRFHQVNIWKGEQFEDEFVRRNPNSKVPVIVDHDAPGGAQTVFESGAILFYLAETSGRFLPPSGPPRFEVMQWLMFQVAGIGPMNGQFNHFDAYAGGGQDYAWRRYATEVNRLYGVLDRRLADSAFIGGGNYSIADIAVYPWMEVQSRRLKERVPFMDAHLAERPNLARWFDLCAQRPGVQRGMAISAQLKPHMATASSEDLDRLFGRGKHSIDLPTRESA